MIWLNRWIGFKNLFHLHISSISVHRELWQKTHSSVTQVTPDTKVTPKSKDQKIMDNWGGNSSCFFCWSDHLKRKTFTNIKPKQRQTKKALEIRNEWRRWKEWRPFPYGFVSALASVVISICGNLTVYDNRKNTQDTRNYNVTFQWL